jgi:hypothetical protein
MENKKYFISYACGSGFGNIIIELPYEINDEKHIGNIEETIEDILKINEVTVLFYTLM